MCALILVFKSSWLGFIVTSGSADLVYLRKTEDKEWRRNCIGIWIFSISFSYKFNNHFFCFLLVLHACFACCSVCRISSGLETASFLACSGLLSSSWKLIADLETHPNEDLFFEKLNNGSDLTTIVFGTTFKHVQPDLLRSLDIMDNPFEFLYSKRNPHFSINHSIMSLFNNHGQKLGQLRSEVHASPS